MFLNLIALDAVKCSFVDISEAYRPPMFRTGQDKNAYSLGKYNNFQEVFGDNTRLWFLPIFTR